MQIEIKPGSCEDCFAIASVIPEFSSGAYPLKEYKQRILNRQHLILVAFENDMPVGFKMGYQKDGENTFYSWLGGVLPQFRKNGIASKLAKEQEKILKENGFQTLEFKTRNYLKPMLIFGLKNGFNIVEVIKKETESNHRIVLRKTLI